MLVFLLEPKIVEPMLNLDWWQSKDNVAILRNIGLIALGAIGLPIAIWRSWVAERQMRLSEAGQNIERFQKGAASLSDERLSVRQAAIFSLKKLAQTDFTNHYEMVQDTLCAFVRENSASKENPQYYDGMGDISYPLMQEDTNAALLSIVALRMIEQRKLKRKIVRRFIDYIRMRMSSDGSYIVRTKRLNLGGCNMNQALLRSADLSNFDFRGSTFVDSDLTNANLSFSDCTLASFHRAEMQYSKLEYTLARGTSFKSARLDHADLSFGRFFDCDFQEASLFNTYFGLVTFNLKLGQIVGRGTIIHAPKGLTSSVYVKSHKPDSDFVRFLEEQYDLNDKV
jgi:uncharacterized protein YjbI with pentapeptide repeats